MTKTAKIDVNDQDRLGALRGLFKKILALISSRANIFLNSPLSAPSRS